MRTKSPIYENCIDRIMKHGERFPKKHGEWYRIKVFGDYWITLDTWNWAIRVHKGKCDYSGNDIWGNLVCFWFDNIETLAYDFGELKEFPMLNYWRLHLPYA